MKNRYKDLIEQTYDFPQEGFDVNEKNELLFNDLNLMELIEIYGTPFKLTFLPKISAQIQKSKSLFKQAIDKLGYKGNYYYCYCTKSNHFSFVMNEALKNDIHIETSSAFDIDIVRNLFEQGKVDKNVYVISNGYKPKIYTDKLCQLYNDGFTNIIPIIDNKKEIHDYYYGIQGDLKLGIRIASEEEPSYEFYTSRLGIRYNEIVDFYRENIQPHPKFQLKMLHFFVNKGIKDDAYYWSELNKSINVYCELKKHCNQLDSLNIGGGFPIRNTFNFNYDYGYMIEEILLQVQSACAQEGVPEPNIFTEFGSYTVGESGAYVFSILGEKQQNDSERWYMIDSSLMTTMPDIWGMDQRFILLPINKWDNEYQRVNIGGLSCDVSDYYNSGMEIDQLYLPKINNTEPLYIGYFHTGAYQDSLSGYGGIKHCLIPAPKHIVIARDENGQIQHQLFAEEQQSHSMLKLLGY